MDTKKEKVRVTVEWVLKELIKLNEINDDKEFPYSEEIEQAQLGLIDIGYIEHDLNRNLIELKDSLKGLDLNKVEEYIEMVEAFGNDFLDNCPIVLHC